MRLKPSPWRLLMLLALSAAFALVGLVVIERHLLAGLLITAFFGVGALIALVALLPGSSYLELSAQGMTLRTLYRSWHLDWSEVSGFFVCRVAGRTMVCWDRSDGGADARGVRALSRSLAGARAGLPDNYGLSAVQLAELLESWRLGHTDPQPRPTTRGG